MARSPNPGGYFLYDTTVLRQATHTCEKEIKSNVNGDVVDPEDVHAVMWRNKRSASMLHSQENIALFWSFWIHHLHHRLLFNMDIKYPSFCWVYGEICSLRKPGAKEVQVCGRFPACGCLEQQSSLHSRTWTVQCVQRNHCTAPEGKRAPLAWGLTSFTGVTKVHFRSNSYSWHSAVH